MPTFKAPPKTRRCPCGQWLAPTRIADGHYRCSACVDTFAKSPPRKLNPKLLQGTMFERDSRPTAAPAAAAAPGAAGGGHVAGPVVPTAPVIDHTAVTVEKLHTARTRAAQDPLAARLVELTRAGLSLADAIEQIEGKDHDAQRT